MIVALLVGVLVVAMLTVISVSAIALANRGVLLGNRAGDATANVELSRPELATVLFDAEPDGALRRRIARIRVENPGSRPVIVTVEAHPTSARLLSLREPVTVRIPAPNREPQLPDGTLLGVADARSARSWSVPLAIAAEAVKVVVRLDQAGGRVRCITHLLGVVDVASDRNRSPSKDLGALSG